MARDSREFRSDGPLVLLPWGLPLDARERLLAEPGLWLTAGASLLLWTALAMLLTSA